MISERNDRRVVVTGLGVVSSIGIGWQEFWKNLLAGKSGISKITSFDTSKYDRHYGGEIKNFNPYTFIDKRKADRMGRASQMAIAAAKLALEDANLKIKGLACDRTGVFVGTTTGEIGILEDCYKTIQSYGTKRLLMKDLLIFPSSAINVNIAKEFRLKSENIIFSNACAAGNYAIGRAADLLRAGKIDYALSGGTDGLSQIVFTGFNRLLTIAAEKCQPFDKNRKGMIPAEGAGMLLLESLESAKKRGALVYAEVLEYGLSCDVCHMIIPSAKGIAAAIRKALRNSYVSINDVDYISAHGTGTIENDKEECVAFKSIFGNKLKKIPISSIKSMLGHTMGAASAIEAITCCLAIKDQKVPPTINFEEKDPNCDIDCVPNKSRSCKIKTVLNNSQAFGGNNACLIISKRL